MTDKQWVRFIISHAMPDEVPPKVDSGVVYEILPEELIDFLFGDGEEVVISG